MSEEIESGEERQWSEWGGSGMTCEMLRNWSIHTQDIEILSSSSPSFVEHLIMHELGLNHVISRLESCAA